MINIAICDDSLTDRINLYEQVNNYFSKTGESFVTESYDCGKPFLEACKHKQFDLIFLDIILGDVSGITVAEKIRFNNSKVCIIFISSSREFAVEGYNVNALSYLVKPFSDKQLLSILDKFLASFTADDEKNIHIRSEGVNIRIPIDKILYIESRDKKLFFYLTDSTTLDTYAKLDDYNLMMNQFPNFLRCHKSYLINMDQVKEIRDNKFFMKNNSVIPVPKDTIALKKKAYYDYIIDKT